jgi:SAM-dependent methyltransferase
MTDNYGLGIGAAGSVGDAVQGFYQDLPFNYDETGRRALLRIKNNPVRSYPELCDILDNDRVSSAIEFGCGTGWFTATLARHWGVRAVGVDSTPRAIARAREIVAALNLTDKASIVESDIFSYDTAAAQYDLVASIGVLHHTSDCHAAFHHVRKAVGPDGYLFIGLYHLYGRKLMLNYYRQMIANEGENYAFRRYQLAHAELGEGTLEASWFKDQVLHPHETLHTFEEVSCWVEEAGLHLVGTSINDYGPINDREEIIRLEREYERISFVRNVLQGKFFPGFFTILASARAIRPRKRLSFKRGY